MDIEQFLAVKASKEEELRAYLMEQGRPLLESCFKPLLESGVEIYWTQYTPHFNDGEDCTFTVHDAYFKLPNKAYEDFDDESWYRRIYSLDESYTLTQPTLTDYSTKARQKSANPDYDAVRTGLINAFQKTFPKLHDVVEAAFGDHAAIRAYLSGTEVVFEAVAYSHD